MSPTPNKPHHLAGLTLTMMVVCGLATAPAAESAPAGGAGATTAPAEDGRRRAAAEAWYLEGSRARDEARLDDAIRALIKAVDLEPDNATYRKALTDTEAMAGLSRESRGLAAQRLADDAQVKQQQLWIEAQARIDEGTRDLLAGRYDDAERQFQFAQVRLENLPYAHAERGAQLRRVESLLLESRARRERQEQELVADRNRQAVDKQRELRDAGLRLERDTINAMLARAQRARDRRDYDEALVLCEQVLQRNRAESRASAMLAKVRRERHAWLRQVTADRWDEEHRLLDERIRADMLPQLEIVRYTYDSAEILAGRASSSQGSGKGGDTWRKQIENLLGQELTLDFGEPTDIATVLDFLQKTTNLTIILDPQVATAAPPPISLKVEKTKLSNILDLIKRLSGLTYAIRDQAIFFTTADGAKGNNEMRSYDIRDLTHVPQSYPGPELSIPDPGQQGANILPSFEAPVAPATNEFIDIVKKVVVPNSWVNGAEANEFNGLMVVNNTAEVHRQVEELLRNLRNQKGALIHVKCKFLTVENSAIEQIGVNWQNFSGPGVGQNSLGQTPLTYPNAAGEAVLPGTNAPVGAFLGLPNADTNLAGTVNNVPSGFAGSAGLALGANEGLRMTTQAWQVSNNLYASAILNAVTKERKGNILYEPDLTLFNGQQAHLVQMNQQSYISDYDVVQGQYQPQISVLSYGTVLDVMAVASADKKYITMTLRPTNTQVKSWRRFGPAIGAADPWPGGAVDPTLRPDIGGGNPMLVPTLTYQAVRTSATIPDGGSLVIGGLANGDSQRTHAGVPFLSHIPFLGRLFSTNGRKETLQQTLVVVQADVVLFEEIEKNL